jgi:glycosyltransferase involved in cell wall biosynthesis
VITNDNPPMNEVVRDDVNGLLVAAEAEGTARSGIPAWTPDVAQLTSAIERLADPGLRLRLTEGARRVRDEDRGWERTVAGFAELLESLS